jgi:5-methylcytosine-specific restriction enzyme subunit McrC
MNHEIVEIGEYKTRELDGIEPTPEDEALATRLQKSDSPRLVVDWLRGHRAQVVASSFVGVVRFSGFTVKVLPKLAGGSLNVLQMARLTRGLPALRDIAQRQHLAVHESGLLDLICREVTVTAERVLQRGLLAEYVELEDALPYLRGRLLLDRQARRRMMRAEVLECRYDEHTTDIPENQLLALALAEVRRACDDPQTRRRAVSVSGDFSSACGTDMPDWQHYAEQQRVWTRRNDYYRDAHASAELLLRGLSPDNIFSAGEARLSAFLIDMNPLFERFVTWLVTKLLDGSHHQVRPQQSSGSVLVYADTGAVYGRIRPDLLITHRNGTRLPVDAKYKLYADKKISPDDVYQLAVYALAYGSTHGAGRAVLIYPSEGPVNDRPIRVQHVAGTSRAVLEVVSVDLPGMLNELSDSGHDGPDFDGPLARGLRETLMGALGHSARAEAR